MQALLTTLTSSSLLRYVTAASLIFALDILLSLLGSKPNVVVLVVPDSRHGENALSCFIKGQWDTSLSQKQTHEKVPIPPSERKNTFETGM